MTKRGPYAKGVAKRDQILGIALVMCQENGYDRTSMREIAREAGLSQAGLLHYFPSKEELFLEVLRHRDEHVSDSLLDSHEPGSGHIEHSVDKLTRAVDRNSSEPGLVRLFVAMSAEAAKAGSLSHDFFDLRYTNLLKELEEDIEKKVKSGTARLKVSPRNAASLLVAAADGLQMQWLLRPEETDMSARMRDLWSSLLDPL